MGRTAGASPHWGWPWGSTGSPACAACWTQAPMCTSQTSAAALCCTMLRVRPSAHVLLNWLCHTYTERPRQGPF